MDPLTIAFMVAALGASVGGSILNYKQTKETNQQMMDFSRESADKQQEFSKELLDYNSPSYQMGRILDAGLNPNLAYDNLDTPVPTGAHADTPQLKAPQIDLGVDEALKVAQINRLNTASENETEKTDAEIKSLYKGIEQKDAEIHALYTSADKMSQEILFLKEQIKFLSIQQKEHAFNLFKEQSFFKDSLSILQSDAKMKGIQAIHFTDFMSASVLGLQRQADYYLSMSNLNKMNEEVAKSIARFYRIQGTGFEQENYLRSFDVQSAYSRDEQGQQLGYTTALNRLNAKNAKYSIIMTHNELLKRYGSKQETVKLILGYSNAFESVTHGLLNISNIFSDWIPNVKDIKTMTTGNVKKTTSKSSRGK